MKKVHICIVSAQLLANYIPIKLEKPDIVFIVSSHSMDKNGLISRFQKMLDSLGVTYQIARNHLPDGNFEALNNYFLELSEEIANLKAEVTLNITGGTKLMALSAYEILKNECKRIIYTDTAIGRLECLHKEADITIESILTIDEYLNAYGVTPHKAQSDDEDWQEKTNQRKLLTKELASLLSDKKMASFLGRLNYLCSQAVTSNRTKTGGIEEKLVQPQQSFKNINNHEKSLLDKCVTANLIEFNGDRSITFKNIDAARYLNGFWLEEYAWHIIHDENPDDVCCGKNINWDKQTRNELDLLTVHNNKMLIIECKTSVFGKDKQKDNDIIYKLDSIADNLRGLYGKKLLLSARTVGDRVIKRAKSQGIEVISGSDIKHLKQTIQQWLKQ